MSTIVHTEAKTQSFISFNASSQEIFCEKTLVNHTPSIICTIDDDKKIIKLIKPRRPLEILKMLTFRSRIHKEIRGNRILRKLGLQTPSIYQQGYGLIPQRDYRYIGFYTMDNLVNKGLQESSRLFDDPNNSQRAPFISNLCQGLITMRDQNIVFSDLTLGNLFVDQQANITWIDTGVTSYRWRNKQRMKNKFNFSIERFLDIHKNVISDTESSAVRKILLA